MSNSESITPTPEGAALLAALAAKYEDIPLPDPELDTMYLVPREQWPEGLAEKVEALLNR